MRLNIKTLSSSLLIVSAALIAGSIQSGYSDANPPNFMSYQGYLEDSAGVAIATTPENYDVIFRIYENEQEIDGENILWSEKQTVTFDQGIFSVLLGAGVAYSSSEPYPDLSEVFGNLSTTDYDGTTVSERYIGITVINLPDGDNSELAPRLRLLSSPYSFLATKALVADRLSTSEFSVDDTSGDVAIGKKLNVTGTSSFTGSMTLSSFSAGADSTVTGQLQATTLKSTGATTVDGALTANSVASTTSITAGTTLKANGKASFYGTSTVASESLNGAVLIGSETGANLGMDGDEIQARSGTAVSKLYMNKVGGNIDLGTSSSSTTVKGFLTVDNQTTFNTYSFFNGPPILQGQGIRGAAEIGSTSSNVYDQLQFYTPGGSRWNIGMDTESGNGDDDLFFLYYNGSSWNAIGYFDPDGNIKEASDLRFKKNIETLENGVLEKLMQISAVRFHKKEDDDSQIKKYGFIAQDVQKVFPEFVDEENGFLALPYAKFGVLAIAGLQELKAEKDEQFEKLLQDNQQLKDQNALLLEQFNQLQERIKALEDKMP